MNSETKRPTAQDIETIRAMLVTHLMAAVEKDPDTVRQVARLLDTGDRVFDYAAACLRAEEEAERVPGSIVEHYGVGPELEAPEDAGGDGPDDADGWIAWEGGECPVYPGAVVECEMRSGVCRVSVARRLWWEHFGALGDIVRYRLAQTEQPDPPSQPPTDPEALPILLTARVNGMSNEEVEAPEDAGGDGPDDADGWIAWEGGECPVPANSAYCVCLRDGTESGEMDEPATNLRWEHQGHSADIVRYRLAQPSQPPTDPEARVRAMSDEEVEVAMTARGVGPWKVSLRGDTMYREWVPTWIAITHYGDVYPRKHGAAAFDAASDGDTTTPEGRAECSRRLLVHLLREGG